MNILKYPNISNSLKESVQTIKLNLNIHLFLQILKWAFFVLIVDENEEPHQLF